MEVVAYRERKKHKHYIKTANVLKAEWLWVAKKVTPLMHRITQIQWAFPRTNAPTGRVDRNWTKSGGEAPWPRFLLVGELARASPTLPGDEDISGWLSPPCLILRDQAGSTCSRARQQQRELLLQRERGLNRNTCIWYVEVWELKLYFYPSARGLKKEKRKKVRLKSPPVGFLKHTPPVGILDFSKKEICDGLQATN